MEYNLRAGLAAQPAWEGNTISLPYCKQIAESIWICREIGTYPSSSCKEETLPWCCVEHRTGRSLQESCYHINLVRNFKLHRAWGWFGPAAAMRLFWNLIPRRIRNLFLTASLIYSRTVFTQPNLFMDSFYPASSATLFPAWCLPPSCI